MSADLSATLPNAYSVEARGANLRLAERVALGFFLYTALLATVRLLPAAKLAAAWALPVALWACAYMETCRTRPWSRVVREWIPLGLILVAYWQIDWFAGTALTRWQQVWLGWDRWILETLGLRAAVECAGGVLPGLLELVYFCLYFIPPACLFVLYATRRRARIGRFLTTALLGTFLAYALLPHFPSVAPLAAYPGLDLPHYSNLFRTLNGWFHANLDIATSVFPSGHVAVAFSAAFGLLRALPERRRLAVPFFAAAGLVLVATVYCRYHYAADGLASVAVSAFAWRASALLERYV